ncbi:MAG: carbon-nitrogen hydrolase family protein [Chitinophagaceae bacterium]|nr:MAG: carbon-nitrogen hydrolase family protein [Chitinophagaceae bacterium]
MIICAAQIRPLAGDIAYNLSLHQRYAVAAAAAGAGLVLFPELSLTGYEPKLAGKLAFTGGEPELGLLEQASGQHNIIIAVGLPLVAEEGTQIGLCFFIPGQGRIYYAKQLLHEDELPYFVAGTEDLLLEAGGERIAPAICYESLQATHAELAAARGATIYLASVAKSGRGVEQAPAHYSQMAKRHKMQVLMANAVGSADDFLCAGNSAIWNAQGTVVAQLGPEAEGLLRYDTITGEAGIQTL